MLEHSSAGGLSRGSDGMFRMQSLAGGNTSLQGGFESLWPFGTSSSLTLLPVCR